MAYNELIKNFEKIRSYMWDFYVYGFKSREDYDGKKSLRSYDDERRRAESWLGDHMRFVRTKEGKNVFISIDSRVSKHNPLYNAFKAKSFTDGDITLYFIIFDILSDPDIRMSLSDIMTVMDRDYLSCFDEPMVFDESTVRKKLKEYISEGIIVSEKRSKKAFYRRAENIDITGLTDVVDFFSEVAPCGVIGSFLHDRQPAHTEAFTFKHHYMTGALDSEILASLFTAMQNKCTVTVTNSNRKKGIERKNSIVPLRILFSVQSGRQYLLAYYPKYGHFSSYRLDYLSSVVIEEPTAQFDELREMLSELEKHTWGVNLNHGIYGEEKTEHVEFTVHIDPDEEFIVDRLYREKRIGTVERIDEQNYRFYTDVYDTYELIPWIRTFICRITQLDFSNKAAEASFKNDIEEMYRMYGIGGSDE